MECKKNPGESLFKQTKWGLFLTLSHNLLFHKGTNKVCVSAPSLHGALYKPSITGVLSLHSNNPWTAKHNDFMQAQLASWWITCSLYRYFSYTHCMAPSDKTGFTGAGMSLQLPRNSSSSSPLLRRAPINKTYHHSVSNLLPPGKILYSHQHTSKCL